MKKFVIKAIAEIGEKAAKNAVCASSPWGCFQFKEPDKAREKFLKQK